MRQSAVCAVRRMRSSAGSLSPKRCTAGLSRYSTISSASCANLQLIASTPRHDPKWRLTQARAGGIYIGSNSEPVEKAEWLHRHGVWRAIPSDIGANPRRSARRVAGAGRRRAIRNIVPGRAGACRKTCSVSDQDAAADRPRGRSGSLRSRRSGEGVGQAFHVAPTARARRSRWRRPGASGRACRAPRSAPSRPSSSRRGRHSAGADNRASSRLLRVLGIEAALEDRGEIFLLGHAARPAATGTNMITKIMK